MGLFRKMTSVSTLGLVDFRSAKDRTAAHTASMARQARKQTRIMKHQAQAQPVYVPQYQGTVIPPPAGWYSNPNDPIGSVRYWDGYQWTGGFKP